MQSQKILFVVGFKVFKYVLNFVFFYLMVLFYTPKDIGTVQFAIAFVSFFSFIFNLGFNIAHLKIYPETDNKTGCIGTLLSYKVIFIFFSLIFYFSLILYLDFSEMVMSIIIIFIIDIIMQSVNTTMSNILIADNEVIKGTFPWMIISISNIVLIILGLFVFQTNPLTLSFIYLTSTLFHSAFLLFYMTSYKIGRPTKSLFKAYLLYTYPLMFYNILTLISANIGIILINFWISTEAVAYYYAGEHFSAFRTIIPNVISLVMISIFSKNIKEGKLEKNKEIIKKITKYSCILFGGIILLSFLYSENAIILFLGERYISSVIIFNILILAQFFIINDIAVFTDLNARGLTKVYSIINAIGEVYTIILTIFFISPDGLNLGTNGVALAILVRCITYPPIIRLILWKKYNYNYNFQLILYLLVILIIYLLNSFFFSQINFNKYLYLIPLFAFLNIAIYFGFLYLIRCLKREDLRYFKLLFNIKSLINLFYNDLFEKVNNSEKSKYKRD